MENYESKASASEKLIAGISEDKDPGVGFYAMRMHSLAERSGAFSGIVILCGNDEYNRLSAEIYLSEISDSPVEDKIPEVVDAIDDLALAMEPEVIVTAHLIRTGDMDLLTLKQVLTERAKEKKHNILYDEIFLPASST